MRQGSTDDGVDTNVLVRILTNDDASQSRLAATSCTNDNSRPLMYRCHRLLIGRNRASGFYLIKSKCVLGDLLNLAAAQASRAHQHPFDAAAYRGANFF